MRCKPARILQRILDAEIRHVATGAKHFASVPESPGESYENYGKILVRQHFRRTLKPSFNDSARQAAGLPRSVYLALA